MKKPYSIEYNPTMWHTLRFKASILFEEKEYLTLDISQAEVICEALNTAYALGYRRNLSSTKGETNK